MIKARTRWGGIGLRIALLGIVPALAAALLTGTAAIHAVAQLREQETHAALQGAVERTEAALSGAQQRMLVYAQALAQQALLRGWVANGEAAAVRTRLETTFRLMHQHDPMVAVLEATDRQGRVLARGHSARAGDDKSGMVDVARALRGEAVVGTSTSVSSGQLSFGATIPLLDNNVVVGTLRIAGQFDAGTAAAIGRMAGGQIMLFAGERLGASTLQGMDAGPLLPLLAAASPARGPAGAMQQIGPDPYLVRVLPLADLDGQTQASVLLAVPLAAWHAAEAGAIAHVVLLGLLVGLAGLGAAMLGAARLTRPLHGMADAMRDMSSGRLDVAIPGRGRKDEIGAMAGALEVFRNGLVEAGRLRTTTGAADQARLRRAAAIEGYTQDFGQSFAGVMGQLDQSSQGMRRAAQRMSAAVRQTRGRASGTANEAASASENLTAVAAAVEQMSASVGEISRQASRATDVAAEAVSEAAAVDARMRTVSGSADRIGDILGVISDVAGRTNLLALNATIEAARAGEAGKGFAVVASEVKQLADQTARATQDVAAQIAEMRAAAEDAATAMGGMGRTIARIDEVATTIAAAVEQQGASTREITQRLQGVAASTGGVSQAMGDVLKLAEEAGDVSSTVEGAAGGIGEQAGTLRAEVESFLHNLRDDPRDRRSYERRPVQGHNAMVAMAGRTLELPLIDLSAGGAGLRFVGEVAAGTKVTIELPGAPPLDGRIVRCGGGMMGVLFGPGEREAVHDAMDRLCAVPA